MFEKRYGDLNRMFTDSRIFEIPSDGPYFPDTSTRCVEIPLVFSAINKEKIILDVGTSLADPLYFYGLLLLVQHGVQLHGLDIVPIEKVINRFQRFDQKLIQRIHFTHGDIRRCTLPSKGYDLILCVSVLEHVGFDKYIDSADSVFDRPFQHLETLPDLFSITDDVAGLNEMVRLLRPGGRLLLTVPFGAGGVFSSKDSKMRYAVHLEYNQAKWLQLKNAVTLPINVQERVFQMLPEKGWIEVGLDTVFPETKQCDTHVDHGVLCAEITRLPSG